MRIQKLLAAGLLTIASFGVFAQGFEGSIYFTKSNMMDVTQYAYHVKGNMVRIDEMVEGSDKLVATLLVDLEKGEMIALSHERNLYMNRPSKMDSDKPLTGFEVIEGQLERSIHSMNCSQYRVKNKAADREVMYWVTEGDYSFFPKLLKILARKDNFSTYYLEMPDLDKKLPLMAQENTLLREKKGFLQVDKIEKKKLDDALFKIPANFEKVER
ncbi:MAG: DUF4412 domain-containing protein [Flavobacteriales bacterium]|nr:DUF4412 domain-containing protein [Flavobacteriales bacterium]